MYIALSKSTGNVLHAVESLSLNKVAISMVTVKILCIGTDRCQQTVQTKIRLLLKKQSDQGLRCLPLHQLLLDTMLHQTLPILGQLWQLFEVSQILEFLRYNN